MKSPLILFFMTILRAKCVIVQNKNNMVNELAKPDMALTIFATFAVFPPEKREKKRASTMKKGAPGGWPTSSL